MDRVFHSRKGISATTLGKTLAVALAFGVGAAAVTRLFYEGFFPDLLVLGRPLPILVVALVTSAIGAWFWHRHSASSPPHPLILTPLLPLFLNLLYLFDPAVDLVRSRFLFLASLWLTAALAVGGRPSAVGRRRSLPVLALLLLGLLPIYLLTMGRTVGRADTFEFQVVVPKLGIVHPTGYPLYLLLAKVFTFLPIGSIAWRVNLASVVFGLAALYLVYWLAWRITNHRLPALLAAVTLGLTPTFWSQAIEAEVYTLHALIVIGTLLLFWILDFGFWQGLPIQNPKSKIQNLSAFLLGLGLTNHLTTVFLLPPAAVQFWILDFGFWQGLPIQNPKSKIQNLLAFLLPLSLYLYLPLRWQAVNGEPMGLARFVDWVVGGRFQGALQWTAWLRDPTRYQVIGRLFLAEWGWLNLAIITLGFLVLLRRQGRFALVLALTWLGYTFYCLNYYVPDLAVFLLPAHLVMALCWAAGLGAVGKWQVASGKWQAINPKSKIQNPKLALFWLALFLPTLTAAATHWPAVDRSQDDGRTRWGEAVLSLPLPEGAAILADSEKIAPLYYLQQAEGHRPDLDILVLPDEATYRAELDGRLAAGQPVYLARYLPGLEGIYFMRSLGPLTEVATQAMNTLPAGVTPSSLAFGPLHLLGYDLELEAAEDPTKTAVTFYWRAVERPSETQLVYLRWQEGGGATAGQHPANNYYPTTAWDVGEIVADYHTLARPNLSGLGDLTGLANLQVAWGPPFARLETLAWQTVTTVNLGELKEMREIEEAARCGWLAPVTGGCLPAEAETNPIVLPSGATNFADKIALLNVEMPDPILRPGGQLAVNLTWQGLAPLSDNYTVFVQVLDAQDKIVGQVDAWPLQGTFPTSQWPVGQVVEDPYQVQLAADLPAGNYHLYVGWYLLATLERLPVLGEDGRPVDDKVIVAGLQRATP